MSLKKNVELFRGKFKLKLQILITSQKMVLYPNGKILVLLFPVENNKFHGRRILPLDVALPVSIEIVSFAFRDFEIKI